MLKNDIIKKNTKKIAEGFANNDIPFQDLNFTQVVPKASIPVLNSRSGWGVKFKNALKKYTEEGVELGEGTNVAYVCLTNKGKIFYGVFAYYTGGFKDSWSESILPKNETFEQDATVETLWVAPCTWEDMGNQRRSKAVRVKNNEFVDPLIQKNEKFKKKLDASNALSPFAKELKQMCIKAGADMSKFRCSLDHNGYNDDYLNLNIRVVFRPREDHKNLDIVLDGGSMSVKENEMDKNIFITNKFGDGAYTIYLQDIVQYGDKIVKMAKEAVKIEKFIASHKYSDLLS